MLCCNRNNMSIAHFSPYHKSYEGNFQILNKKIVIISKRWKMNKGAKVNIINNQEQKQIEIGTITLFVFILVKAIKFKFLLQVFLPSDNT